MASRARMKNEGKYPKLSNGRMGSRRLPPPSIDGRRAGPDCYSLIRRGPRALYRDGQNSLVGKARERPDLVRHLRHFKREGLKATYEKLSKAPR